MLYLKNCFYNILCIYACLFIGQIRIEQKLKSDSTLLLAIISSISKVIVNRYLVSFFVFIPAKHNNIICNNNEYILSEDESRSYYKGPYTDEFHCLTSTGS